MASDFYDPRAGDPPIRLAEMRLDCQKSWEPPRTNCFTILSIESGSGLFWSDAASFSFAADSLLFFVPYQHIRLEPAAPVRGNLLHFHANFLCVETFHAEVGCSGLLFNDPYGDRRVRLDDSSKPVVAALLESLGREQADQALAFGEMMLAHLKTLLIVASRLKASNARTGEGPSAAAAHDARHPLLTQLAELIEAHYRTRHAPADYADLLHVTPKTLGRIVREHLGTTPTELIRARVLTHAKWQLLHTLRPVKEIAREVGFPDELYFSRLFKAATGCSPTFFREFETEIRGGSNLSMFSADAPIQASVPAPDTSSQTTRPRPGSGGKRPRSRG